jgi:glycolate oxidase FAD binding subunit
VTVFVAHSREDVADAVQSALASDRALDVFAGQTRSGLGSPSIASDRLDVSGLVGVIDYQPGELILTARPGTLITAIEDMLMQQGQMLAFEPAIDPGASLGGAVMVGCAGSRRPFAGAARDHFLGFEAVSGRGEVFRAGGKVVKNVTGYDLPKLFAGSFGTLGIVHEMTIKVMPRLEIIETLIAPVTDWDSGFASLRRIMRGDYEVSGLALAPSAFAPNGRDAMLIRLEGTPKSVAARKANLLARESQIQFDVLDDDPWLALGSGRWLDHAPNLWRISIPADRAAGIVAQWSADSWYADWAGGRLFWIGDGSADAGAGQLRARIRGLGHATLIRGDSALRQRVGIFQPLEPSLAALSRKIKSQFDPKGILNPGRMGE